MIQGSSEWHAARLGRVTASKINAVMAKLKNGSEAADRKNYRAQLVVERLTGEPTDSYSNAAMQWGIENEPAARDAYQFVTDNIVKEVGFVDHPEIEASGASPDGLIADSGLLEIKCPNSATHIDYLLSGKAPAQYLNQMQWQMACTGREWCDFASYDPRMPTELQLFIVRVDRDDAKIAEITEEVKKFLAEVDALTARLKAKLTEE